MKVLRLRSYFYPENVSASHLVDDLDELYEKNKIVTINYAPMPSRGVSDEVRKEYKKKKHEIFKNGYVEVYRFPMFKEGNNFIQRTLKYACCNVVEYLKGIKAKDIDLLHCSSTPPTQGMLSGMVAKKLSKKYGRKVPFLYNLQDIFPDSLVNAGMTKEGSAIWKIGRKIENYTYKNADKIIVISEGFKKNLLAKGVPEEKIEVVPNWVNLENIKPVAKEDNKLYEELGIDKVKFTVVYAGNIGEMQGGEVIVEAACQLQGDDTNQKLNDVETTRQLQDAADIQFVIFGGGSQYEKIKELGKDLSNIKFFDLMPEERVSEVYSLGDVNLITCKKGTGKAGFPSKTWSIMACGRPIIASFDEDSDLGDVLKISGAGRCVNPGDVSALAKEILEYKNNVRSFNSNAIRQYAIDNASKEVCANKYVQVMIDLVQKNIS